ncbi:MAG: sialate O-acetylesterase, partial [Trueperaceae bacterium]
FLVPTAKGGSQLTEWQPGSSFFEEARSRAEFAADSLGIPVSAVVWFQGESETKYAETRRDFIEDTDSVLKAFHDDLPGNPEIIFVQLSKRLYHGPASGNEKGHNLAYQEIREKQRLMEAGAKQLAVGSNSPSESGKDRPYYHMVVSHDLPMSDVKHLSAAAQRALGGRIANTFLSSVWTGSTNGTFSIGPRLERVILTGDKRSILVDTTMEINDSAHYNGYFAVFVGGEKRAYQSIGRDANDPTRVRIGFDAPLSGNVQVRYMPPDGTPLYQGSGQAVHGIVGGLRLQLPAFGGPVEPLAMEFFPGLRQSED